MHERWVSQFRVVALWEGLSFLALLLIAMPLKYLLDAPLAVRIVGMAHGVLFLLYVGLLGRLALWRVWGPRRVVLAALASVIPGGTFWFERTLRSQR